ncbi:MAG: anti-sigma factor [Gemmatimonadetes bacterium]|nr:MAG: anti-sigma factor [Gemmatimonadota bacterium]
MLAVLTAACGGGDDSAGPPREGTRTIALELSGLRALDPVLDGVYQGWVVGSDGVFRSVGTLGPGTPTVSSPIENPARFVITVEPPDDADPGPSASQLLGGEFQGTRAELTILRYVTPAVPLEDSVGTHVLFTPSDDLELGKPSNEDAGIWVFNIEETSETRTERVFLEFTPLNPGWVYEGWVVHDFGGPQECWVSYGKFSVDSDKLLDERDDTGLGPYSGQLDYVNALPLIVEFPGDDWLSNPHDYPVPCDLPLPFDLNGDVTQGVASEWTHAITVEPDFDRGENTWDARPFTLRPYRNPIGEGGAAEPRVIQYIDAEVPRGVATLR